MKANSVAYHIPVLADRVVAMLAPSPGKLFVDGTLGGGGHAELLLRAGAEVIGLDQDEEAIAAASERLKNYSGFKAVRRNFSELPDVFEELGVAAVDGVLLDLGVSSHQLDDARRGFSFRYAAPLDMRMDTHNSGLCASDIIENYSGDELADLFFKYGEERYARRIAKRIIDERAKAPITTTDRLADIIASAVPPDYRYGRIHPATRSFQALRIAVNRELSVLETALNGVCDCLKVGARIAVIAYHSLEDRLVKNSFRNLSGRCTCPPALAVCVCESAGRLKLITSKPIVPDEDEIEANPRAHSAKLRVAERI
ncbi:16S rRNA (cytosine(1402)-N(4))-methyltransferase RsmH [bacterium]|nr:16S rRNA (cytosine(1402)-N(4))-methyltransferase RsmH [bacterium]